MLGFPVQCGLNGLTIRTATTVLARDRELEPLGEIYRYADFAPLVDPSGLVGLGEPDPDQV